MISRRTLPSPLAGEGAERSEAGEGKKLTHYARAMRRQPTDAERKLWFQLRDRRLGGHKFRRQVPMGRFIADFVCLSADLIVEADGGQHNKSVSDAKRDAWFADQGFKVLRFWNNEIMNNIDGVMQEIEAELERQ